MAIDPPVWTPEQLAADAGTAIDDFRDIRLLEPLESYLEQFDLYRQEVDSVIEQTVDLTLLRDQAVEILTQQDYLTVVRYLASPAISVDDLKVIADASIAKKTLIADPEMAHRIIDTVMTGLDRERFPWVSESREPTETERTAAVVSTAALIATQKVQTARRNTAKTEQEKAVADSLVKYGLTKVQRRTVENLSQLPNLGEFCEESMFGGRKADLIIRLWDGRVLPTECKVSNSSTNSVKRLNNDAAAKAKTWTQVFGTATCVPAAVLSGVFKVHNLKSAQDDGLTLFWGHSLDQMINFIESTRP